MHKYLAATALVASLACAAAAQAAVVDVTDTVSGSAGAWVHTFTVANNLPNTNVIYFFGVHLGANDIVASPGNYSGSIWINWNNSPYGGSALNYDNNWIDLNFTGPGPGQSLSGFKALDSSAVAQTSVAWFAYAAQGDYSGPGCFHCGGNPGFEGIAGAGGVPEPATWALMIGGFGLAGSALRRRRAALAA